MAVDPNDDVVLVMKRFGKEGTAKEGSVEMGFFWPQVTSPAPCRLTSICFSEYLRILPDPSALDRSGRSPNVVVLGLASKLCTHREGKSKHASPQRETALERHGTCELEHYDGDGGKDRGQGQGWKKLGRGCHVG